MGLAVRYHAAMSDDDKPVTFGQRIRFARQAAKLSQGKLGQKVGTSQGMISELESDKYPSSTFTPRLAEVLNVSSVWLAYGRGRQERLEPVSNDTGDETQFVPRDLASSLRRTVMAIAREWGVDPRDLTDPSDDALVRMERDIEKAMGRNQPPRLSDRRQR